ncbi:hypothetical protein M2189_004852 [Bradyrhizobium japonicum]|uniref:hypothetical protein n=1 Tax=Bradyrhizobium japonicum TaxID=375 RepID=UPI002166E845|nr:hypothetical protein [Bradyrhizobium japonicum]MCS3496188.1 hypothetical protein [Bradyrhizobium japonicum]MCS3961649.1 hypothetical protein [Bradyrhizobium japonicum]MCS3993965.1 hypothetical protein [Bradyrhizobium japonicum]
MTDNVAPVDHERPIPQLKVKLVEDEHQSFRDCLMAILASEDLWSMTITLRGGKEIVIDGDAKNNPRNRPVHVRVGKDYIEVDVVPGAGAGPIYEIVQFSEIARVQYF